jgi:phosphoribosyl 1,2-cyclic phosphodiesterase
MNDPEPVSTPVFMNATTMTDVCRVFPYMISQGPTNTDPNAVNNKGRDEGNAVDWGVERMNGGIRRRVANVRWTVFPEYFKPFYPLGNSDMEFTPFPLVHGGDYICAGFAIRGQFDNSSVVAYLSDVSFIPPETMQYLLLIKPCIDVLVIDSLLRHRPHSSHFSLDQAIDLARVLRPTVTRAVGATCEMGLHDEVNSELANLLAAEGLDFRLGYDGERLEL